ncbi:hypothetical protein FRC12_009060 [Ceratobasidium sp. 428]|nr:hypothetical protein FRC12_009060 [Ceratobasidium sp. 428]
MTLSSPTTCNRQLLHDRTRTDVEKSSSLVPLSLVVSRAASNELQGTLAQGDRSRRAYLPDIVQPHRAGWCYRYEPGTETRKTMYVRSCNSHAPYAGPNLPVLSYAGLPQDCTFLLVHGVSAGCTCQALYEAGRCAGRYYDADYL